MSLRRRKKKAETPDNRKKDETQVAKPEQPEGEESAENVDDVQRIVDKYVARVTNPLSGIRAMCVACMGAQVKSVTNCPSEFPAKPGQTATPCPLWPFRMGKNTMDARYGVTPPTPAKGAKKKAARKKR